MRAQLAFVLEGVVTQTLLPEGARAGAASMACEIMVVTPAIRALIRDDKIHQIYSAMQAGKKYGMQTMNDALYQLYISREVAQEECVRVSSEPNEFLRMIGVTPMEEQDIALPINGNRSAAAADPYAKRRLRRCRCSNTPRGRQTGQIQKGQLDVASKDDVSAYLRKNRLILVSVREAPKQIKLSMGGPRVKTRDIVIFTRQFATMINAGLPLVQALDILAEQTENKMLADVTRAVVYDVESGNTLADAFSQASEGVHRAVREHGRRR